MMAKAVGAWDNARKFIDRDGSVVTRYQEIILHAGPGKTGSTSIQKNCHKYRELLAAEGIVYPGFDLNGRHLINHSDAITGSICDPPTKHGMGWRQKADADPEGARAQLRAQWEPLLEAPRGNKLILSGESVAEYSDEDLQKLRQELEAHCDRLRVLAFIRSPQSSLESILQQRVKGGLAVTKESILGVVRKRYERLKRNFPTQLEVINFHQAADHPRGLVGFFMHYCGLPEALIPDDDFSSSNERISLEAFGIMYALNHRYPRRKTNLHGVQRAPHDLRPLKFLPGQPFQIEGFTSSRLGRKIDSEGRWLERELGFKFPRVQRRELQPQWQEETLESLEGAALKLKEPALRLAVADHLEAEASRLKWRRLQTAATLAYVGSLLRRELSDKQLKERREELSEFPVVLANLEADALPWYKDQLVEAYPFIKLLLPIRRLLVGARARDPSASAPTDSGD